MDKPQAVALVSGGVDSTVAAIVAQEDYDLIPLVIDTGFMRKGEITAIVQSLKSIGLPTSTFDGTEYFFDELGRETDAEKKRAAFRRAYFGSVAEVCKVLHVHNVIQGTIAPDWIESQGGIKTHHNVTKDIGVDPLAKYDIEIIEPIRDLYKDQVRDMAKKNNLPDEILYRQPFPGPGLLIRCLGRVSRSRIALLQDCTEIVSRNIRSVFDGCVDGQYFCALIPNDSKVTGVRGDERAYGDFAIVDADLGKPETWPGVVATVTGARDITRVFAQVSEWSTPGEQVVIRAITSRDFMTAEVAPVPVSILKRIDVEMKELKVGNVVFDITTKPPGTIEFE
jgi:GMP synthase (glutamine-hydrolysing)